MKTPIKPSVSLKRISIIILLLMFVIIGIQSQKSVHYGVCSDSESFKKALSKLIKSINQDVIYEYTYYQVISEPDCKIHPMTDNLIINMDAITDINIENRNIWEEDSDEEMKIEDWMLDEFDIDPCKSDFSLEEDVKEEEMEIKDWMLNIDNWVVAAN